MKDKGGHGQEENSVKTEKSKFEENPFFTTECIYQFI